MDGSAAGDRGTVVVESPSHSVERSPSDVFRLAVAVVLLAALIVVQAVFGDTLVTFATELLQGLDALPHWIVHTVVVG
ncbi:MAG TPA: hypothetical protein VIZ67_08075, partial [Acidimicrobiales bacterium]